MSKTVVGLFSTFAQAQQVKQTLAAQGYPAQDINVVANDDAEMAGVGAPAAGGSAAAGSSSSTGAAAIGERIGGFFRNLTGGDEAVHHHYATGVNQGGALLAVTVNDPQAAEVASLLKQHGARDLENQYDGGASPVSSTQAIGETTIPIVEEQLVVGKREVDRGGVRIYSHVTERPVDAEIALHEERVTVERRAVNRPATAADFQAGSGGVVELTATGEEAVVGKTSRVVEEVTLGKQSSERTEAVHDTVRKTEVDVEEVGATTLKKDSY